MKLALVRAIYDGHDTLRQYVPKVFDDAVLVTDDPDLVPHAEEAGYRVVMLPRPDLHPRQAAKIARMRPDLFTGCEASIWLDGSLDIIDASIVDLAGRLTEDTPWLGWRHPDRDCLYDEAEVCINEPGIKQKYDGWPLAEQVAQYRQEGMPEHYGLWETGMMVRLHTDEVNEFGNQWLGETWRWSPQDQLSFPFLSWFCRLEPEQILDGATVIHNPWTRYAGHTRIT